MEEEKKIFPNPGMLGKMALILNRAINKLNLFIPMNK
jgi:hypothetical protein